MYIVLKNNYAVLSMIDSVQNHGGRMGAKLRNVMDNLTSKGKQCVVVSMMPLKQLLDRQTCTIPLMTTWNKTEPHITPVYGHFGSS